CFELAYTAVAAIPASTPTTPPRTASRIDSARNWVRIWLFVAPRARRRPISERRSSTEMIMMFATPTAPTISATTPSPRKRLSNAPAAAARAVSTSEGWLYFTSLCASGVGVPGGEHVGGLAYVHLVRCLGVGSPREQLLHRRLMAGDGAHIHRARRSGLLL